MLFNSIDFGVFLPVVFSIYWLINRKYLKVQNLFIVLASYFFYACWDWRFLSLIFFSTAVDFWVGVTLSSLHNEKKRKALLWVSIITNLGLLGFFKYFNFFQSNFIKVFSLFGLEFQSTSLAIILPVGISFYTFQTMSYTIDVYKKKLKPTNDFLAFAAFVSFFPQLVAGPIERASNLLPQFFTKRKFEYAKAVDGLRQILWGLFKKVVIADTCAEYANLIFDRSGSYGGSTLLLGAFLFAFQIYGDFSGYSDIAIGTSRLFGFDLKQNFAFPYFSRDIAEFWRRWHISLSTWFRDYLYIPLGGSRGTTGNKIRNVFIIFLVSGFWHGAEWKFVAWGGLHALYFLPLLLLNRNRTNMTIAAKGNMFPTLKESGQLFTTFTLVTLAWVFFRAGSITLAFDYLSGIFSSSLFSIPEVFPKKILITILVFLFVEWVGRAELYGIEKLGLKWPWGLRYLFYYILIIAIILAIFGNSEQAQPFIYFQF